MFNGFQNRVEFSAILESLRNFGGGFQHPKPTPPSVRHCLNMNSLTLYTLLMKAEASFKTSVHFYQNTRCHMQQECNLYYLQLSWLVDYKKRNIEKENDMGIKKEKTRGEGERMKKERTERNNV